MKLTRLIPMLPVKHLPTSVAFYEKLGFAIENRHDEWGFAMLASGDCRLMLDQSINVAPDAPRQSVIYLYPEDIADYHREMRAKGLDVPDLETTFYGHTEFRIEDPDGNRLWIGQPAAGR
jgi:catechol 2,3-dioxygenase-like lactoylglutathione lyase family enzyme